MDKGGPLVVIGFAHDASWGPAVRLLVRGRAGLQLLEEAVASHRSGATPQQLTDLVGVESEAGEELTLEPVGTGERTVVRIGRNKFAIGGSVGDWSTRAELLHSLEGPGFQFLDYANAGEIAFVVEFVKP